MRWRAAIASPTDEYAMVAVPPVAEDYSTLPPVRASTSSTTPSWVK